MLVPSPADLPCANPTTSHWQVPKSPLGDHLSNEVPPTSADYVVIGSGITGSSLAYRLLERKPSAKVVLLEARDACSGASGRNGGHCRPGRYTSFARDSAAYGTAEAGRIARLEESNVRGVATFAREQGIACDLEHVETVDVFEDEGAFAEALAAVASRRAALAGDIQRGEAQERWAWSADEARRKFGTPGAVGAVSFGAYTLSPYEFVCGVLRRGLEKGLELYTHTPVLSIEPAAAAAVAAADATSAEEVAGVAPSWTVCTIRGDIRTGAVLLATNGYTSHLLPQASAFLTPVRNQCTAQRPGNRIAASPAFLAKYSVAFVFATHTPGVYGSDYMACKRVRSAAAAHDPRSEARTVVFGGGRFLSPTWERHCTDDATVNERISTYLGSALRERHFGPENWGEKGGEVEREWTGIVGLTPDENPVVGEVPGKKGMWVCAGFNGHGMALAFRSAEALALMVTGAGESVGEWLPRTFRADRACVARAFGRKALGQR